MTIQFNFLTRLANHLLTGMPATAPFNFTNYRSCALHECPVLWPKQWHYDAIGEPYLIKGNNEFPYSSGREFFGLKPAAYDHLFVPRCQKPEQYGGQVLEDAATKEQVAGNILAFCETMKGAKK